MWYTVRDSIPNPKVPFVVCVPETKVLLLQEQSVCLFIHDNDRHYSRSYLMSLGYCLSELDLGSHPS